MTIFEEWENNPQIYENLINKLKEASDSDPTSETFDDDPYKHCRMEGSCFVVPKEVFETEFADYYEA